MMRAIQSSVERKRNSSQRFTAFASFPFVFYGGSLLWSWIVVAVVEKRVGELRAAHLGINASWLVGVAVVMAILHYLVIYLSPKRISGLTVRELFVREATAAILCVLGWALLSALPPGLGLRTLVFALPIAVTLVVLAVPRQDV